MNPTPAYIRQRAYHLTQKAIAKGELTRPETCEDCGLAKLVIVAHHVDYSQPTIIRWLCGSCHKKAHIKAGDVIHWRTGKPISTNNGRPKGKVGR